jgi:hypothetical protein
MCEDGPRRVHSARYYVCKVFYFVQRWFANNEAGIIGFEQKRKSWRQTDRQSCPIADRKKKNEIISQSDEVPYALRPVSRPVSRDRCAVLLHNSDHLDASLAFFFRPGRRPRSDLGPHHIVVVDDSAVEDFGLVAAIVGVAAEEVHADAVALLHHRPPLLARRDVITARLVLASNSHNPAVGTCSAAGRGEDSRENPRETRFEGWEAGADDADLDFEVAPEGCHGIIPAYVFGD